MTMASTLTVTSNPTRTSPVKRGKWILEEILGTPPPPAAAQRGRPDRATTRTPRGSARPGHDRSGPGWSSTGPTRIAPRATPGWTRWASAWRTSTPSARGATRTGPSPSTRPATLPDGKTFAGPVELKAVLLSKIKPFSRCLTEKLMTYALGRGLEYPDRCVVDKVADSALADGGKFSRLVSGIVHSDPFQKRGVEGGCDAMNADLATDDPQGPGHGNRPPLARSDGPGHAPRGLGRRRLGGLAEADGVLLRPQRRPHARLDPGRPGPGRWASSPTSSGRSTRSRTTCWSSPG